jgi:hypothetical protein
MRILSSYASKGEVKNAASYWTRPMLALVMFHRSKGYSCALILLCSHAFILLYSPALLLTIIRLKIRLKLRLKA